MTTRGRRQITCAFAAFVTSVSCSPDPPSFAAQGTPVPASRTSSRDIDLRVTRVHLQDALHGSRLRVPRTVEVIGTIEGQPHNSDIRVAVSCDDEPYRVVGSAALTFRNGDWRVTSAMLVPPTLDGVRRCDLVAIVADPLREPTLNQAALSDLANQVSNHVPLEVDGRQLPTQQAELKVDLVAGQPVVSGHRLVVSWLFDIHGTSQYLRAGHQLWPMVACDQGSKWRALGDTSTRADGSWTLPALTLPGARPGSHCSLVVVASASRPAAGPYSTEDLWSWGAAWSPRIELVQRPASVLIGSVTDSSGAVQVIDEVRRRRADGVVVLNRELSAVHVAGDVLPAAFGVSIGVQAPGSTEWRLFGPAHASGPGLWASTNVRLVARDVRSRERIVRAVVSRERLHGRSMSAQELDSTALGLSEFVYLRAPASVPCRNASARLTRVNGAEPDENAVIDAPVLHLQGILRNDCDGLVGWVGLGGGPSRQWRLAPLRGDAEGRWSTSLQVPAADSGERDPRRRIGLFIGPDSLGTAPVDEAWLRASATTFQPMALTLAPRPVPWTATAGAWLRRVGALDERSGMAVMQSVWLFALPWFALALLLAAIRPAIRRLARLQAWLNGWRDAKHVVRRGTEPTAYEERLRAECDEARARTERQRGPRIAALASSIGEHVRAIGALDAELLALLQSDVSRRAQVGISLWSHHAAFGLATLGESAFNMAAFRALQEPDAFTFLMSLSVCATLPVAAYFIGLTAKRWQTSTNQVAVLLTATALVIVGALWAINEIRVAHLNTVDPAFLATNPALHFAFIPVNLLVVFATSLLAFMRHDPVEGYGEAYAKRDARERARTKKLRAQATAVAILQAELKVIDGRYRTLQAVYRGAYERHRGRLLGTVATAQSALDDSPAASAAADAKDAPFEPPARSHAVPAPLLSGAAGNGNGSGDLTGGHHDKGSRLSDV